jgi:hypothetical protein
MRAFIEGRTMSASFSTLTGTSISCSRAKSIHKNGVYNSKNIDKNGIMYQRALTIPQDKSFFLFGPRGTGKTTWVKNNFPSALYIRIGSMTSGKAA